MRTTQDKAALTKKVIAKVQIPSVYSLKILNTKLDNLVNKQGKIMRILNISTNFGVVNKVLAGRLKLYLLNKNDSALLIKHHWLDNPLMVNKRMLSQAKAVAYHFLTTDHASPSSHQLTFQASRGRVLVIKVTKPLTSIGGGLMLFNDYQKLVQIQRLPVKIQFVNKGSLLTLTGNRAIGLWQRGLSTVKVDIYKVRSAQIYNLISQTTSDIFTNLNFINSNHFNLNNVSLVTSYFEKFSRKKSQQPQHFSIDFNQLKKSFNQPGLYVLKVTGWDKKKAQPLSSSSQRRVVLMTNLGLIVKGNIDNSHDVFVQSIESGKPVSGAKVTLLGINGAPIQTATTNQQGHALLPAISYAQEGQGPHAPLTYLVEKAGDISLLPYRNYDRRINFSRFDIFGRYMTPESVRNPKALFAYVFTNQGLYQPGSLIHFASIVKQKNWGYKKEFTELEGLPISFTISSPSGKVVDKQQARLTKSGLLTSTWQSSTTAQSGLYTIDRALFCL